MIADSQEIRLWVLQSKQIFFQLGREKFRWINTFTPPREFQPIFTYSVS